MPTTSRFARLTAPRNGADGLIESSEGHITQDTAANSWHHVAFNRLDTVR